MGFLTGCAMKNKELIRDYLTRAGHRLAALEVLYSRGSHADVVREGQEIVELCLKALLRGVRIEPPRSHDVSEVLIENVARMPASVRPHVQKLAKISRSLRRDRELAFYGSEDLTPSEFYKSEDAQEAFEGAKRVYEVCRSCL